MSKTRFILGWALNGRGDRLQRKLLLLGPWHPQIAEIMRERSIRCLDLDGDMGWAGQNLDFLESVPELEGLSIRLRGTADLSATENLKQLGWLEISSLVRKDGMRTTQGRGVINFGNLTKLERIQIDNWSDKTFRGLENCRNLRTAWIEAAGPKDGGSDLGVFSGMKNLSFLLLRGWKMVNFEGLGSAKKLKSIVIEQAKMLETLQGLEECPNLEMLVLRQARKLRDLNVRGGLSKLTELILDDCRNLQSIRPIKSWENLQRVSIYGGTNIGDGDLSPLLKRPRLKGVILEDRRHYSHKQENFPDYQSPDLREKPLPKEPTVKSKPVTPMAELRFWKIIEDSIKSCGGKQSAQCGALSKRLQQETAEDIQAFEARWDALADEAYTWDLWAAAYIIAGGCSDDGFIDFRSWLISKGRKIFRGAIQNVNSLAGVVRAEDKDCQFENIQYVASRALEKKLSASKAEVIEVFSRGERHGDGKSKIQPSGQPWKEDDLALRERFPFLVEKFWKRQNKIRR